MKQNKEPKDCLKCKRRGTDKCAFLNRNYNEKCRCLWVLSEGHNLYNDDLIKLHRPGDPLASSYLPDWFYTTQEMDYSRDDTKQIVNGMRPYNN